ncbi:PAS domain-containing protein [Aureimonas sp. SK2]|uniref:PAS domain-containing protein n=1 Tax=Aureimonas sp. SK2 TaxID=3015992 RepID=UPI0024443BC1|nr:PAS domain-containing protein [Aureimonas sp. SK2]
MSERTARPPIAPQNFLGVWTWNVKTGIVIACSDVCLYANIPSDVGIHGVATERFYAAIHPDDRDGLRRQVAIALQGEEIFLAEYRMVSVEYGTVWVRSSGRCFRDPAGNPSHISGYLSRIDAEQNAKTDDATNLEEVIEHLTEARLAAARLSRPTLSKLIAAVLLEAGFQLAGLFRRN